MITLSKMSEPSWEKDFDTEEEVRVELTKHICVKCLEELGFAEPSIEDLLWTQCGAEFIVEY